MSPFGGVAGRLAVALLAIVAGVLTIVYVIVVPFYQHSLQDSELQTLTKALRSGVQTYKPSAQPDDWAAAMAEQFHVRAVVFSVNPIPHGVSLMPVGDSNQLTKDSQLADDPVALKAARQSTPNRGIVERGGQTLAEAAVALHASGPVLLLASPLDEQLEGVSVVRRRVLVAGSLAIGFAVLLGYLGASVFANRIRRLEAAAERIASGNFDEAVVDPGSDELAQLARAFERMRLRLAQLDRARGEFIANASHELRTPLFSLAGFLELLDDPELDEATRLEFLAQMREQVVRLTKLATDLLDLSRLDAGRLSVESEPVELGELADALASEFRPRAAAAQHQLELVVEEEVAGLGDAERVFQIGRALVENALVHTPPGTTVRLSVAREGGRATLAVADDGPGIPADARQHVFQRFYRLDGARASGSGLGLAIARELAEVMGGRIELDSGEGWTRFTLVLSAAPAVYERAEPAVRAP
jgi:two-component system, OmpR family, sensor kinase